MSGQSLSLLLAAFLVAASVTTAAANGVISGAVYQIRNVARSNCEKDFLAFNNATCVSGTKFRAGPTLRSATQSVTWKGWKLTIRGKSSNGNDLATLTTYIPSNTTYKCDGIITLVNKSCPTKDLRIASAASAQLWEMVPVAGKNLTFMFIAQGRGTACPKYMSAQASCSSANVSMTISNEKVGRQYWQIQELFGPEPNAMPPGPVKVSVVYSNGNTTATVTFEPPQDQGSSPIVLYWVTASPIDPGSGAQTVVTKTTATTTEVTGLVNGAQYTFTVQGENAYGIGPVDPIPSPSPLPSPSPSPSPSPVPSPPSPSIAPSPSSPSPAPTSPPSAPTNVQVTLPVAGVAVVSWSPTAQPSGVSVFSYAINCVSNSFSPQSYTAGIFDTSATLSGMPQGVTFTCTVTAVTNVGNSSPSTPSSPFFIPQPPLPVPVPVPLPTPIPSPPPPAFSPAAARNWQSVACSSNGQIIAAGTADGGGATNYVYVSVDGGYTWTQRQSTAVKSFNSVSMEGSGVKMAASVGKGISVNPVYYSSNSGTAWAAMSSASQPWQELAFSTDGSKLFATANDGAAGGIYLSADGGQNFNIIAGTSNTCWNYALASSSDGTKVAAGQFGCGAPDGVYYSTGGGAFNPILQVAGFYPRALAMSGDGNTLIAAFSDSSIKRSINAGGAWIACGAPPGASSAFNDLAMDSTSTKIILITNTIIFTSVDSCTSWTASKTDVTMSFNRVAASADFTTLVAVSWSNNGHIFVSKNSGATWNVAY